MEHEVTRKGPLAQALDAVTHPDVLPHHEQGVRNNWQQFALLGTLVAFTGGMVGVGRPVLSLIAGDVFHVASTTAALTFLTSFGLAKAISNLGAGAFADRFGRRRVLIAGWLLGLPVPLIILAAPTWGWVVAANALLGVSQGLAWSMALNMKIDLAGPRRRGFAVGFNESVGYFAVGVVAFVSALIADSYGIRYAPFVFGAGLAGLGLFLSFTIRETAPAHAERKVVDWALSDVEVSMLRDRRLLTTSLSGFANNLKDGLIWGLLPLVLIARGESLAQVGAVVGLYPVVWAVTQFFCGTLSDRFGRLVFIVPGFLVQAVGLTMFVALPSHEMALRAAVVLGVGTGMVYPTLIGFVSDGTVPRFRASGIGFYRLVRDMGYVGGALVGGLVADLVGLEEALLAGAFAVVAASVAMATLRTAPATPAPA